LFENKKIPDKEQFNSYARYSAMAFQMAIIIGVGTFGGYQLDIWLGLKFKIFTIVLSLFSVILAIYFFVKDFIHPKK
jgi:ATP synthase protein I